MIKKQYNLLKLKNKCLIKDIQETKNCVFFSKTFGVLLENQIEAFRRVIAKKSFKKAKLIRKIKPTIPITAKSKNARMGKGKGKFKLYISNIKYGQKLFEIKSFCPKTLKNFSTNSLKKLPLKIKTFFFNV